MKSYLKVEIFLPTSHVLEMVEALNQKGFLGEGPYDYVYASSKVLGHWRPLQGAKPFIGEADKVSEEEESKLEFRITAAKKEEVLAVIRGIHPYETPVINMMALV